MDKDGDLGNDYNEFIDDHCADYNRGGGDATTTRTTTIRIIRNMEGKAVIMQEATNKLQIQNV